MKRFYAIIILLALSAFSLKAQKFAIGTNAVDYLNFVTFNVDGQVSLSRHFSLEGQVRYNPFIFNARDINKRIQNRKQSYQIGFRYWPWSTFSEWWFKAGIQYQNYQYSGFNRIIPGSYPGTREGHAGGLVFGAGYSLMVTKHFNIDFGLEAWSGCDWFYSVRSNGKDVFFERDQLGGPARQIFLLPTNLYVSCTFVLGEFKKEKERKK